jgi:sialic acid synthase SpsE
VGERLIGGGNPVFVIAEAGVNHNGDIGIAHRLIDAAKAASADAVKFQTFDPASLAAPEAPTAEYQRRATGELTSQREMLQRLALGREAFAALKVHAEEVGLTFLSSPFDYGSADLLDAIGVAAFKIPSGEVTNTPFLEHVARKGKPMLVSTGMCDMLETAAAVDAIRASGLDEIALFHCVSSYPASPAACNLRSMATLRAAFRLPVGWSDHTPGSDVTVAAVALGAELIEKHITLDRTMPGPDHAASLEPEEFRRLVESIRTTEASLGDGTKRPTPEEAETAIVARKSLHWLADREPGQIVAAGDFAALRPGVGLAPSLQPSLVGRMVARSVRAGTLVTPEDLGPES